MPQAIVQNTVSALGHKDSDPLTKLYLLRFGRKIIAANFLAVGESPLPRLRLSFFTL